MRRGTTTLMAVVVAVLLAVLLVATGCTPDPPRVALDDVVYFGVGPEPRR